MTRHDMIAALDKEIQRLESARTLLRHSREVVNGIASNGDQTRTVAKRQISPEGRKRIIEAQRRRWAKQKKEQSARSK